MQLQNSSVESGTLCQRFAAELTGLDFDALSEPVRAYAKRAILDALGAALAGSRTEELAKLLAAASTWGCTGTTTVWGTSIRLSAPHAALANGTATHALEVDDFGGCGHSGAVVVPSALAVAEHRDISGRQLLSAVVAGYEAAARVMDLVGSYPVHNAAGWHSTGTCGTFGAATAAARVLHLNAVRTAHALALSGTYTGGLWCFIPDGAMSKRLHAGKAAEGGVAAAFLAAQDFTGPLHLFEPGWGSFTSLYGGENAAPESLLRNASEEFLIFRTGFKPYACCRGCHSSMDIVLDLKARHGFRKDDVAAITIYASEQQARQLGKQNVANLLDAQMSLPYSVAVALAHGSGDLRLFRSPYLHDPELARLAHLVNVVGETPGAAVTEPTVELRLNDGRTFRGHIEIAKGAAANPLSDNEIRTKFLSLATLAVSDSTASDIADFVEGIESVPTLTPLFHLLANETV